jgi:hypothetical protein
MGLEYLSEVTSPDGSLHDHMTYFDDTPLSVTVLSHFIPTLAFHELGQIFTH